jgi:eukaryotic-like serine/threonine-protein kinase
VSLGELIDGKYELVAIAGEGGMATVFKAIVRGAAGFARPVAVKRIKPEYRGLKNYIAMFIEEARVGSELAHPNIVQVHDFVIEGGSYYLVMEWVEGMDLGTLLRVHRESRMAMPWEIVAAVAVGTLRGLGAAHERRGPDGAISPVIHRDVSPHNILLGNNGAVKLSDFGLARARDRAASLTAPGTVKGKLSYLAPEVTFGKPNSPQSDMFSTAIVVWECLTQTRLFDGRSDLEVFKKIRACVIPPLSDYRDDIPADVEEVLRRGLEADPSKRFASANDFAFAFSSLLAKQSVDADSALVAAIHDAQARLKGSQHPDQLTRDLSDNLSDVSTSVEIEFSQADINVEPVPLTKVKT